MDRPKRTSFDPEPPRKYWSFAPLGRALRDCNFGLLWLYVVAVVALLVVIVTFVEWDQGGNRFAVVVGFWGAMISHLLAVGLIVLIKKRDA